MKTPNKIDSIYLECSCVGISITEWNSLMKNATRGNKKAINRIVKNELPELYSDLCLNFYNPYNYFKTKSHLILVHSGIEYFLRYE